MRATPTHDLHPTRRPWPGDPVRWRCIVAWVLLVALPVSTAMASAHSSDGAAFPAARRSLPRYSLLNISPPYLDYPYFQNAPEFPFRPDATGFDPVNAWWLAEASTLVYASEPFAAQRFAAAGLPHVFFFHHGSTQCYVAHGDRFAIVAFRGSEIWKKKEDGEFNTAVADFMTNVDVRFADWEQGGRVHRGFKEAIDAVWPALLAHLRRLQNQGLRIWVTGHSLGGALATLCAARLGSAQGVYTFGSPRVGDAVFKETFAAANVYRLVNGRDIVPRVPPPGLYVHVGNAVAIDENGHLRPPSTEGGKPAEPRPRGDEDPDADTDPDLPLFQGLVPAPFLDHVPTRYATHLWNAMLDGRP